MGRTCMTYEFDHLVVMARDCVDSAAQSMIDLGFFLTPTAHHNLGSINRLAIFQDTYLEILGWEPNGSPIRREIADEPYGLNALVFKTTDAARCRQLLIDAGFNPNPVQDLTRPAEVAGELKTAEFKTVRFATQPIQGLRVYFCQHLTPEFVWQSRHMTHPNGITTLDEITISAGDPAFVYQALRRLLNSAGGDTESGYSPSGPLTIQLSNTQLVILKGPIDRTTQISSCVLGLGNSRIKKIITNDTFRFVKRT